MALPLKLARFLNLLLTGLLAGLLVGIVFVELSFLDLSAFVYTAVEQPNHRVSEPIMPVFNTLVIGSGILVLFAYARASYMPKRGSTP